MQFVRTYRNLKFNFAINKKPSIFVLKWNFSEKGRNRNEKLGEYFLNLLNTTLGTTVLGMIVSSALNFEDANIWMILAIIGIGLIATITFANIGKKFLNK